MTRTLDHADHASKIALALGVIVFYALGLINGPFALVLFLLACLAIAAFLVRVGYRWITRD